MKKPLYLALLCGAITMILAALYLNSLEITYRRGAQKEKVLIARQYINQGTMIDAAMIEERTVPKDYIQPKALQSIRELVSAEGKRVYMTLAPVERGEQVVTTKLSLLGFDTGISSVIPSKNRAITLLFDKELVSGIIKPGNRVDLIGVFEYEDQARRTQQGAFTVLQDALVLSVGKQILGAAKPAAGQQKEQVSFDDAQTPVSLSVTPREAEAAVLAAERGTVRFALRPTGDDSVDMVSGVRMQDIAKEATVTIKPAAENDSDREAQKAAKMKQQEVLELLNKYKKP
jgi:pilus assembly protein CpaB